MATKVIVTTKEGKVRGVKKRSCFSGAEYYSFFGVPYGQSPAKYARFKDPVKAKPWENVLDATLEKEGCFQFSLKQSRIFGTEDCLYNNIHTPQLPSKGDSLKPVIFCIHPGGFFHGSPETWYYGSPNFLMHQDVVYVCVAYRLHILGFLNLEMENCSGNQTFKDIILSLHWLKENISSFGGDPNNITLLGGSSGAVAVHVMMLSPAAKGLFHKAVIMGLYFFNPTFNYTEKNIQFAIAVAQHYGYDVTGLNEATISNDDKKKLLAYLKKVHLDIYAMTKPEQKIDDSKNLVHPFPTPIFGPTVDAGENGVLPKNPRKLINSTARIPLMFGMCERESAMAFTGNLKPSKVESFYKSCKQNYWGWGHNLNDDKILMIKEKIDSFYLKGHSMESAPLSLQMDIQTDVAMSDVYGTLLDIVSADLPSSVYVYKFQFEGNAFTMKDKIKGMLDEPVTGTYHADEFSYWASIDNLWKISAKPLTPETAEMVETFTKMITTFARTGDPNNEHLKVKWRPSTPEHPCYLNINDELDMVDGKLNDERMKFWEDLKKQFYQEE